MTLLTTSVKIRYTVASERDRKMSMKHTYQTPQIYLSLCCSLLVACRSMKQTTVIIAILSIFTSHERTCRFIKQAPDRPQNDRTPCVIAQQYSFATVVLLGFGSRKKRADI
jgi:hypothetical protein